MINIAPNPRITILFYSPECSLFQGLDKSGDSSKVSSYFCDSCHGSVVISSAAYCSSVPGCNVSQKGSSRAVFYAIYECRKKSFIYLTSNFYAILSWKHLAASRQKYNLLSYSPPACP